MCPKKKKRDQPTLRLRHASHEKALFRGSADLEEVSAVAELEEPSTTMETASRRKLATRDPH